MWVFAWFKYLILWFAISLRASRALFQNLCYRVLRAPRQWFDTVPVGRILNRFTADFNALDSRLATILASFLRQLLEAVVITGVGLFVSHYIGPFALFLLLCAGWVGRRYLLGAREIKRLESNAKSPIFEHFGTTLAGMATIRAWGKGPEYLTRMYDRINAHATAYSHLWLFNRWMSFRQSMIGATFTAVVVITVVSLEGMDASLAGFAMTFALQFTNSIIGVVRMYANVEMNMNATERIIEYSNIEIEDQGGMDVPATWYGLPHELDELLVLTLLQAHIRSRRVRRLLRLVLTGLSARP